MSARSKAGVLAIAELQAFRAQLRDTHSLGLSIRPRSVRWYVLRVR